MNEYAPNSHKFKKEQQETRGENNRVEKVVKGTAKTKKKKDIPKLASVFISDDAKNVKSYVVHDVIVPTIKKTLLGALDMILNGGSTSYSSRSSAPKVSYRKYYDDPRDVRRVPDNSRSRFDYDDILFENRGDAEAVRMQMQEIVERYGFVTVADLYDMADLSAPFTSNKYGWMSVRDAEVMRAGDGYIIKLPRAVPIE